MNEDAGRVAEVGETGLARNMSRIGSACQPKGSRPLIVIPARFSASASALRYRAEVIPVALVVAVHEAGGEALVVHPEWSDNLDETVRHRFWMADGVLLPGGGDMSAHWAGQADHATQYDVDEVQDAFDLALARMALDQRIPLLSICRGTQVVNVVRGGNLIQELTETLGADHRHRRHDVRLTTGSPLFDLAEGPRMSVSCYHHQGLGSLGKGLRIAAHADDTTVEAITLDDYDGWYLGVQWHPEDTATTDPVQAGIFRSFIAAAAKG